jgi:hypothetical protein
MSEIYLCFPYTPSWRGVLELSARRLVETVAFLAYIGKAYCSNFSRNKDNPD